MPSPAAATLAAGAALEHMQSNYPRALTDVEFLCQYSLLMVRLERALPWWLQPC